MANGHLMLVVLALGSPLMREESISSQFNCDRAFYITSDPRNPSTSTLANWDYLDGRHGGLTKDVRDKLRVAKADDSKTVRANCGRTKTVTALKNVSVDGADSAELICQGCNWYEACKGGHVFGYLGSRQEALQKPRTPNSSW